MIGQPRRHCRSSFSKSPLNATEVVERDIKRNRVFHVRKCLAVPDCQAGVATTGMPINHNHGSPDLQSIAEPLDNRFSDGEVATDPEVPNSGRLCDGALLGLYPDSSYNERSLNRDRHARNSTSADREQAFRSGCLPEIHHAKPPSCWVGYDHSLVN